MYQVHQIQGSDNHGSGTIETCRHAWSTLVYNALLNDLLQGLESWLTLDTRPTYE
jgi:hypothetical protein